jgi:hypothetical protein
MVNTLAMRVGRKKLKSGKARLVEARTPYHATGRKRAAKQTRHSSKLRTGDSTDESLAEWCERQHAPEQPPTEAALEEVWRRWHVLSKGLTNDERVTVLLTTNVHLSPRPIVAAYKLLHRRFGPRLDEKQYATSVDTAHWWSEFRQYLKDTLALGEDFLRANLAFEKVDDQAPGRIAAYRTRNELLQSKPTILEQNCPSLADVEFVRSTHDSYLQARQHAQVLLNQILYPRAIRRGSQRLDASVQRTGPCNLMDDQARHDAPILMPRPPENLPRHLQIAQLAALGKAKRIVEDFMKDRFLKLPKAKRDEFLRVLDNPPSLATRCGSVAPWLADNAPLLRRLRMQWNDVQAIAESVFPVEELPASLRNFSDAHGIKLNFKRGANFINQEGLTRECVMPLLSPPPKLRAALPPR